MKYLAFMCLFVGLFGCHHFSDGELKSITEEVIHNNRGVMIRFEPINVSELNS